MRESRVSESGGEEAMQMPRAWREEGAGIVCFRWGLVLIDERESLERNATTRTPGGERQRRNTSTHDETGMTREATRGIAIPHRL